VLADVTIVIPAFRCARYLPATVASALRCEPTRILIAEDRSGDDTLEVAKRLAANSRGLVEVIENQKNLGMTGNWQNAVEQVQTPLTLKLDADDLISAAYVREAVAFLRDEPRVGIVGGGLVEVGEDFGLNGDTTPDPPVSRDNFVRYSGVDAAKFVLNWTPYPASSTTMFRMEAWRAVGGYDVALNWCSDRELWFRIARKFDIAFCNAVTLHYRVLGSNVTSQHRGRDRFCYELSHMFRRAKPLWQERELRQPFRRALLINAKAFFGSTLRAAKRGAYLEMPGRLMHGIRDLISSV
jgi:glycosyltransferase involved in cell wall biosynthesis